MPKPHRWFFMEVTTSEAKHLIIITFMSLTFSKAELKGASKQ